MEPSTRNMHSVVHCTCWVWILFTTFSLLILLWFGFIFCLFVTIFTDTLFHETYEFILLEALDCTKLMAAFIFAFSFTLDTLLFLKVNEIETWLMFCVVDLPERRGWDYGRTMYQVLLWSPFKTKNLLQRLVKLWRHWTTKYMYPFEPANTSTTFDNSLLTPSRKQYTVFTKV